MRTCVDGLLRATLPVIVALLVLGASSPRPVHADAIVGTGTASSCIETALDTALAAGGSVAFNCGASPVTIIVTSQKAIAADTDIDGGSFITLSGGVATRVFVVSSGVTLTLTNVTISDGVTDNDGGAIVNYGTLAVTNSTFSDNNAGTSGGAIVNHGTLTVTNGTFSGNIAPTGFGGALVNNGGTLTLSSSTFSGNSAGEGATIVNNGTLNVANSTFSGNSAVLGNGGALVNLGSGTLNVTNSTFSGDTSSDSGGAVTNGGTLNVTNSTFFGNSARNYGGAIDNSGTLTVTNTTFSGNRGSYGIIVNDNAATLMNTIVSGNFGENCFGTITDGGHNIDSGSTCGFSTSTGSLSNTDPVLDPVGLGNNGGPTQTVALEAGSPASNAGDDTVCASPPVNNLDQRGYARPGAGAANCSIGAYEYNSGVSCASGMCVFPQACISGQCATPTPTSTPTITPTPTPNATATPTSGGGGGCAVGGKPAAVTVPNWLLTAAAFPLLLWLVARRGHARQPKCRLTRLSEK